MSEIYRITSDELRSFIERYERLENEKSEITDQQKDVMAEAQARGYDKKAMKRLIADRKKDPDTLEQEEAILDLYKEALGMKVGTSEETV